jgi:nucleotide-binding universal stress UspA family protein
MQPKAAAMQKILVPIDGSACAMRALGYAIKLAKEHGPAELHLVTVYPEPVIYGEIQVYISQDRMKELQRKHCEDVLRPAVEEAAKAGVIFTSEMLTGETASEIVRRTGELGCDCIVMGTHGRGAIGALVMGSIAAKVVHLSEVPVTLVK